MAKRLSQPGPSCPECQGPTWEEYVTDAFLLTALELSGPGWVNGGCDRCYDAEVAKGAETISKASSAARRADESGVGRRYRDKSFDDYKITAPASGDQIAILEFCRNFVAEFKYHAMEGTWILMVGGSGTGKGHLCAAIINQIIHDGYSARFIKIPRLLLDIKDSFSGNIRTSDITDPLRTTDLLVVDEIGLQHNTTFEEIILYDIFDYRYEEKKPIIFTSNESLENVEKSIGPRVVDRLMETGNKVLQFNWPSYRGQKPKE